MHLEDSALTSVALSLASTRGHKQRETQQLQGARDPSGVDLAQSWENLLYAKGRIRSITFNRWWLQAASSSVPFIPSTRWAIYSRAVQFVLQGIALSERWHFRMEISQTSWSYKMQTTRCGSAQHCRSLLIFYKLHVMKSWWVTWD